MLLMMIQACVHAAPEGTTMPKSGAQSFRVHVESKGGTRVALSVENTTESAASFCVYHTPFEGIRNNIFVVERDGTPIPYRGKMAKRARPGADDHRLVPPSGTLGPVKVNLSEGYELTSGTYTVRYRGSGISGLPDSNVVQVVVP